MSGAAEQDIPIVGPVPSRLSAAVSAQAHPSRRGRILGNSGAAGEVDSTSSQSETDGFCCPICLHPWASDGDHHVCCLPCGHIYGMYCIRQWIQHRKSSAKCPQCNRRCTLEDVRKLYAPRVAVVDDESQKKIQSLEAKCASLESKAADWQKKEAALRVQVNKLTKVVNLCKKEAELHNREAALHFQVNELTKGIGYLELVDSQKSPFGFTNSGHGRDSITCMQGSTCCFLLQEELEVNGARIFDVDVSGRTLIIARRLSGMGGVHSLSQISLTTHERQNILLPSCTKAVKDLRVSPGGGLALLASLEKKISVLSLQNNKVILAYDLPAPAWSCAWDRNSSHYVYAGLQNGLVMVFDMRQTGGPMETLHGLSCDVVHTVLPLLNDGTSYSGVTNLLTASSGGVCQWTLGGCEKKPYLLPVTDNMGVCISLASSPCSNNIVASFRPKSQMSRPSVGDGHGIQGSHVVFKKMGHQCYKKWSSASVDVKDIRWPRSVIIDIKNQSSLFASGDEGSYEMVLHKLPFSAVTQRLKPHSYPIRDVRYVYGVGPGLLGCLSDDKLQLYSPKLS